MDYHTTTLRPPDFVASVTNSRELVTSFFSVHLFRKNILMQTNRKATEKGGFLYFEKGKARPDRSSFSYALHKWEQRSCVDPCAA